tara:strand:+ start:144 stop:617 length:474 start_codon:yes stop_codon:yes gene_type:complete
MAIARGAGTEILRSAHFENIGNTGSCIILMGEQHHIYTVLNITAYYQTVNTATNTLKLRFHGYDSNATSSNQSAQEFLIFNQKMSATDTFVWNEKFTFNGHEPTAFTGPLTANATGITNQNAIADQGSSVAQYLDIYTTEATDNCEVHITYIDQNNA